MNVPHDALFQNCINGSAPLNRSARVLYKKSPEPLAQIQNNFTEIFLIIPSTKFAKNAYTPLNTMAARFLDKKIF